jgi:hypothetical protein
VIITVALRRVAALPRTDLVVWTAGTVYHRYQHAYGQESLR